MVRVAALSLVPRFCFTSLSSASLISFLSDTSFSSFSQDLSFSSSLARSWVSLEMVSSWSDRVWLSCPSRAFTARLACSSSSSRRSTVRRCSNSADDTCRCSFSFSSIRL
uniref:Putative secreted protein n=1 Tax=Ixodes ricinus TaxID=34613 RepID=A0A6B0UJ00_IXORI